MSDSAQGPTHTEETEGKLDFYYEGSQFPWLLRIVWMAFLAFAVVYTLKWYVPDLIAYLKDPLSLIQ